MCMDKSIETVTLFKRPEESPGYVLWHVSLAWRSLIEKTLKPFNLTHPQFVMLATTAWLTRKGKLINQIDISKAAGLDPNTTSQIIRGLERKKCMQRTRALNERSKNPFLTDRGSKVLEEALPAVEKADAMFFESLSAQEISNFINTFSTLLKGTAINNK